MELIYIGSFYCDGDIQKLKKMGSDIDYPAHRFQTAILSSLLSYFVNAQIITSPNISPYPKINTKSFKSYYGLYSSHNVYFTGYCNVPILKLFSKYLRIKKFLNDLVFESDKEYVLMIYSVHSPFLLASRKYFLRKNIRTCLIVPDLPEYMSAKSNVFYKLAKKIDKLLIDKCIVNIDSFVLLSPYMKNKLQIEGEKNIQIEGIYEYVYRPSIQPDRECKSILYTGNLDKRYGIIDLLNAFSMIKNDTYQLLICGTGDSLSIIIEKMKLDKRIHYLGTKNKEDIYKLQQGATLLINPRHSSEEYTKYSFPSKTMEYMASGRPVLMSHLKCIPKEYDDYVFYFDEESPEGMKNKILEICEKDEKFLYEFGKKAQEFILNNKTSRVQVKKIYDMINSIEK